MIQSPDGVVFLVQSKTENQQNFQTHAEFIADSANNYPESNAQEDANAYFQQLFGAHSGGTTEYRMIRYVEYGYEVRPIPS